MDSELLRRDAEVQVLPTPPRVVSPGSAETEGLLAWLDEGLRGSRAGRVLEEYAAVFSDPATEHVVIHAGERPASHALARLCTIEAGGRALRVGMIGLVYTDPAERRAGLAARCVGAATRRLGERGAVATMLWSDQPGYYERLGFLPAGLERLIRVDVASCRAALRQWGSDLQVAPPTPADWPVLEGLHDAKPARVARDAGRLALLAEAPECRVAVCRDADSPVAYAACGKGDDFRGVVHEWAGSAAGVLACLCALLEPEAGGLLLAGPCAEPASDALHDLEAPALDRPFALVHLGAPETAFGTLAGDHPHLTSVTLRREGKGYRLGVPGREIGLEPRQTMELLFGPELPLGALERLDEEVRCAIRERLPWPLFVWGFDSI